MFKIYDGREFLYQWDTGCKLVIEDATIKEVHFCNRTDSCALVCETYVEDGITLVNIPNILLQTDYKIRAYAYDGEQTRYDICLNVKARSKPADYAYTETEILTWYALNERVQEMIADAELATKEANEVLKSIDSAMAQIDGAMAQIDGAVDNTMGAANRAEAAADIAYTAREMAETCANQAIDAANSINKTTASFANALKGETSGAAVSIKDISPVEHTLDVKVRSKNLFNPAKWVNAIGEVEVNGVKCLRVGENASSYYKIVGDSSTAYMLTIAFYRNSDFTKGTNLKATTTDGTQRHLGGWQDVEIGNKRQVIVYGGEKIHFEGWGKTDICVRLDVTQLELGTTATAYAPYVPDISAVKVKAQGKNLFNIDAPFDITPESGKLYSGWLINPTGATVTITIIDKNPDIDVGELYLGLTANGNAAPVANWNISNGAVLKPTTTEYKDNKYLSIYKWKTAGIEAIKERFDIQVEYGTTSTEYEPYNGGEYSVEADGTVKDVASIYPKTTLITDTNGAVIDCIYNKDINKAFAELYNSIISLGGNI